MQSGNIQRILANLWILATVAISAMLTACDNSDNSPKTPTITVYAAASLSNALDEINATYQQKYASTVNTSYASSGTLAKQIQNHAPADVFLSADTAWVDALAKQSHLLADSQKNLLANRLVLITPKDNPATIGIGTDGFFDPKQFDGKLCIGNPDSVPAGKYAKQALTYLGMWDKLADKLVQTENVRSALNFVNRGECQLGVVYRTDAAVADNVKIVATFDKDSHQPIVYPLAIVQQANSDAASVRQYYEFLQSDDAQRIYQKYGFEVLP
ncbi:molybdate ABC transporter substrate-binding protein [Moraxella marmotae]|uniref:molybdate ABC transporter substrate-binding protein n=1 Tax=Moraxella marmotae TaxID=3344520 RepID=UPI0035F3CD53